MWKNLWRRLFGKPKLYVIWTDTFGMKMWVGPGEGLVGSPGFAWPMTMKEAERFTAIPTCSPIIDWVIEEAKEVWTN